MAQPAASPPSPPPAPRRRPRLPLLLASLGAAVFLGVFQAAIMILRNDAHGGMALGLARLSLMIALVTMLLLLPLAFLLRRRHAEQRAGDRLQASWAVCFGLAAGLVTWALAALVADALVPRPMVGWAALAAALPAAVAASFLRLPRRTLLGWCWGSVLLLVLCFVPWPNEPRPPGARAESASRAEAGASLAGRPDVVLVTIDTLRADHLGAYGRKPSITPALDRIAAEGVVFGRAVASAPWTTPSVASMMTGLPTVRHDAGRPLASGPVFERSPLGGSFTTLAERFAAAGYRTRAVISNGFLSPGSGMDQGFDEYVVAGGGLYFAGMLSDLPLTRLIVSLTPAVKWGDPRAQGLTDTALRWLAEDEKRPLFLWLHYFDPHAPYQRDPARLDMMDMLDMVRQKPPEPQPDGTIVGEVFGNTEMIRSGELWLGPRDRAALARYYAGEVAYTDRQVGRLFDALRRRSARRPVVAAVTADHGEELWDHGRFEHGHDYYSEVTRVPLIFWGPGRVPAGRRVDSLTGLIDLAPTLLEQGGLRPPARKFPDQGRSLVALLAGKDGGAAAPGWYAAGGNLYGPPSALLEEGPWCYILRSSGIEELYDATADPHERRNVAAEHPDLLARFRGRMQPQLLALMHTGGAGEGAELTPEQLQALRALGYVR